MPTTNPEWLELRLSWPADERFNIAPPRNGDDAHKLAAKAEAMASDDPRCRVDSRIFHYAPRDDAGRRIALDGLSPFRYGASATGMWITAVGDEAVDLLAGDGHRLTRAISRMAGTALQEQWRRGFVRVHASTTPRAYRINHYVVSRRAPGGLPASVGASVAANDLTPDVRAWVEQRISAGLARQAAFLNIPEPASDPGIRLVNSGRFVGWTRGGIYYGTVLHSVVFMSDWALDGPWSVGSLCLLGSGSIRQTDRLDARMSLAA